MLSKFFGVLDWAWQLITSGPENYQRLSLSRKGGGGGGGGLRSFLVTCMVILQSVLIMQSLISRHASAMSLKPVLLKFFGVQDWAWQLITSGTENYQRLILSAVWLAGWLAGCLVAGWLAGCLGFFFGWLAGWLVG